MSALYAVGAMASDLYNKFNSHPILGHFFQGIDKDKYTRMMSHLMDVMLREHVDDFENIVAVHKGMVITDEDAVAWLACLRHIIEEYVGTPVECQLMIQNATKCMRAILGMIPTSPTKTEHDYIKECRTKLDMLDGKTREEIMSGI